MRNTLLIIFLLRMFCPESYGQDTCFVNGVFINSLLIDPTGSENNYDTNSDGNIDSNDEFIEICNSLSEEIDLSGWMIGDNDPPPFADYTFPDETFLAAGECLLLVANYCPVIMDDCDLPANVLDMSLPFLGFLGNAGDVIQVSDGEGSACSISYGSENCETIDPLDLPGYEIEDCQYWGSDLDGCPLLAVGDSCDYVPMPLPVELISFIANVSEQQSVKLEWTTSSEINNMGFNVQWKPTYEAGFKDLSWINGHGNSQLANYYRYVHDTPVSGTNYYRLKQVDYNGVVNYSNTIVVNVLLDDDVKIYPSLVEQEIFINGNADVYLISIYSLDGQLIFDKIKKSNNEFLDLSLLRDGCYVVRVFNGRITTNFKILKI